MKYLKLYEDKTNTEEGIEDFFRNAINWREYNYLLDRITKYEDQGYIVHICINVYDHSSNLPPIYGYVTGLGESFNNLSHKCVAMYERQGLFYRLWIVKDHQFDIDFTRDFYGQVSGKFKKEQSYPPTVLMLKSRDLI